MTPKLSNLSKKIFLKIPSLTSLYSCPELVSLGQLHSASGLAGPFSLSLSLPMWPFLLQWVRLGFLTWLGAAFPEGKPQYTSSYQVFLPVTFADVHW